jgi:hypothetical protein
MDQDTDTIRLRPALRNRTRNLKACTICGAPAIGNRCSKHPRERGTTTQRGYGSDHQQLRAQLDPIVMAGHTRCVHPDCGELIKTGDDWDLAHNPNRTGYLGPMHATCNRRTATAPQKIANRKHTP